MPGDGNTGGERGVWLRGWVHVSVHMSVHVRVPSPGALRCLHCVPFVPVPPSCGDTPGCPRPRPRVAPFWYFAVTFIKDQGEKSSALVSSWAQRGGCATRVTCVTCITRVTCGPLPPDADGFTSAKGCKRHPEGVWGVPHTRVRACRCARRGCVGGCGCCVRVCVRAWGGVCTRGVCVGVCLCTRGVCACHVALAGPSSLPPGEVSRAAGGGAGRACACKGVHARVCTALCADGGAHPCPCLLAQTRTACIPACTPHAHARAPTPPRCALARNPPPPPGGSDGGGLRLLSPPSRAVGPLL